MAAARAGIIVAIRRFHADIGNQAGEQGAVDLLVAGFFLRTDFGAMVFFV